MVPSTQCVGSAVAALLVAGLAHADPCRLHTAADVATVQSLIAPSDMLVEYCVHCDEPEPFPLRVRSIGFEHHEPEVVREAFGEETYPLEWLEQAERDGSGPLIETLLARIEAEPADPRLLYVPVGDNRYASLGKQMDCAMPDSAPAVVEHEPVVRDLAQEKPPTPFLVDITGRCYDGSCPFDVDRLESREEIVLHDAPDGAPAGVLEPGEVVYPARAVSHVTPTRAEVVRDHRAFLAGDVIYVLDGRGEGYYQVWHYGRTRVEELTGVYLPEGWNDCVREDNCWARADGMPAETWWLQVKRDDGTTGWAHEPLAHFNFLPR